MVEIKGFKEIAELILEHKDCHLITIRDSEETLLWCMAEPYFRPGKTYLEEMVHAFEPEANSHLVKEVLGRRAVYAPRDKNDFDCDESIYYCIAMKRLCFE